MAKVKLGNVKGSKGDKGDRGSLWRVSDKMTGQSTSGTAFPGASFEDSVVNDICLNPTTFDLYRCQTAGDAATAKWVWECNIKGGPGPKGDKGDPTTVDAALSESSANPIQNKAVAVKFKDMQDSLGRVPFTAYPGTALNDLTNGLTVYYDSSHNAPSQYGIVYAVSEEYKNWIFQVAFSTYGDIFTRMKINQAEWTEWVKK